MNNNKEEIQQDGELGDILAEAKDTINIQE